MAAPYSGRCLCGGIRFTIASEPSAILSCFCEHCSKGAGSTNQIIAKFAHADVKISAGQHLIATYTFITDTSSGAPKAKAFCRTCGAPLWTVPASARGTHLLIRPSLLSEHHFKPQSEIFVGHRPAWATAVEGAEQWQGVRGK
ncbi:Mss4-like protein [Achaetomium macrosporum]|uniref:Mss4-like protein n=1 Tax=Achaetomium macrosporum TaxID=79813 RepID=A0AAN7C5M4_9PEZI|nr:Mss4-like protein [Achaetomium macrosporum]